MSKKEQLTEAATDYALEHGLIGLSLRPMAAALGTSDRMLIYHFGSKDELVTAVLEASNARAMRLISTMEPAGSLREAIPALWATYTRDEQVQRSQRMYVEAAALGLLGREPYASSIRSANIGWIETVASYLQRSGVEAGRATRMATLVDATFNGVFLDRPLDEDAESGRIVQDLADALA